MPRLGSLQQKGLDFFLFLLLLLLLLLLNCYGHAMATCGRQLKTRSGMHFACHVCVWCAQECSEQTRSGGGDSIMVHGSRLTAHGTTYLLAPLLFERVWRVARAPIESVGRRQNCGNKFYVR